MEGKTLVTFEGVLDSYIAPDVAEQLEPLYELSDTDIILDCTKMEYISSSGLRIFLSILKNAKPKGSHVFIRGLNNELQQVFAMTGFNNLFEFK